jgi:hypothetical protein
MDKAIFAVVGFVVGLVAGWLVFSPAAVKEEVKLEETAPVSPAEPEVPAPVVESEVVPMPPQETVEPAPAEAPKAAN